MRKKFSKILSWVLSVALLVPSLGITASAAETNSESVFTNFVTVEGTKLMDGDKEVKFVSLNYPQATSDNAWESENAVKTIKAMGGNVTRSYTIPVWNGHNAGKAYVTGVDANGNLTFDENALNSLDNLLAACNKHGVRLIIPLVDHWHWIGGMDGYVWLADPSVGTPSQEGFQQWAWNFYTDPTCMDYFKQMISHLLERENSVTGVKYKDDPAILCWETGNELGDRQQAERDQDLFDFTNEVYTHIKSIDQNHLVLDGRMSFGPLSVSEGNKCDILGAHYYEGNYAERCKTDTINAHNAGKPFILGEFGGKIEDGPCIEVFEQGRLNDTNGIMMWSLRAHKDGYGYFWHDEDGGRWAAYHWPGFASGEHYGETEILRAIYAYAQIANGVVDTYEEAKELPIPAPETAEAPLLYGDGEYQNSFLNGSVGDIKWRGVVGGAWYEIQRADGTVTEANADSAEWTTIADEADYVYDGGRNWEKYGQDCIAGYHDETAVDGQTYSYRLRACNESGVGLWSNIVTVNAAKHVVVDDFDMIAVSSKDATPTEIRNTYSSAHSLNVECTGSGSTIRNASDTEGYIEYEATIPVKDVAITAAMECAEGSEPKLYVSADGIEYTEVEVAHTAGTMEYTVSDISASEDYYFTRIYVAGNNACTLDKVSITYVNDGESYREELDGAPVGTNVMIQDNTFGLDNTAPMYTTKASNVAAATGDVEGITTGDNSEASIIYKTGDDMTAYRVVTYVKDGVVPVVESSYDGVTYNAVPVISEAAEGDWTKVTLGNLNVTDGTRVVRVTFPEGSQDKMVLASVEVSSGTKTIPLSEKADANIIEDGEYYFGDNDNLEAAYDIAVNDDTIVYAKELGNVDFSEFDSLYAWVKPDVANNAVYVDSVYANLSTKVDDFESYNGSEALLDAAYERNGNGGKFELTLDSTHKSQGYYGARIDYDYEGKGYAGATKTMDLLNLSGYDGFVMWIDSDGSGNDIKVQMETDVSTFAYTGYMTGDGPTLFYMPFEDIWECDWAKPQDREELLQLDPNQNLKSVSIYTDLVGEVTSGTFYVDDIRGANFAADLEELTAVTINDLANNGTVSAFPYTISGTAEYAQYVSVTVGEKVFNVAVNEDGTWSYNLTADAGIFNAADLEVKVGVYYANYDGKGNGDVVAEAVANTTLTIDVEGNEPPIVEEYDNLIWSWDFADGLDGWTFDYATEPQEAPHKTETAADTNQVNFVTYSGTESYDLVASYTIEDVPNGVYTLQNDIKSKSNMLSVKMALSDGTTENEVITDHINTEDVMLEDRFMSAFNGDKLTVTNNTVVVKYYIKGVPEGVFAVGDLKLYLAEGADLIKNGDFTETVIAPNSTWVKHPAQWNVVLESTAEDAIKTQSYWMDQENGIDDNRILVLADGGFEFSQDISVLSPEAGTYKLSADVLLENDATVSNFVIKVANDAGVIASRPLENGICELADIMLAEGDYTVTISGSKSGGTIYLDDVSLVMTSSTLGEDEQVPETSANGVVVWDWSFAEDGSTGWVGTGKDVYIETKEGRTYLCAWSQDGYNAVFSYDVTGIPNGTYKLGCDIKVKSNLDSAYMAITDGVTEVKSVDIDTNDLWVDDVVMDQTFTVSGNDVTVKFYANAPVDPNGATFLLDDVKLYLVEGADLIQNGDFTETVIAPNSTWVKHPAKWNVALESTAEDAVKTQSYWQDQENGIDDNRVLVLADGGFEFSQNVSVSGSDAGTYKLSADILIENEPVISNFVMKITNADGEVASKPLTNGVCELADIALAEGDYTVTISGGKAGGTIYIDDVSLIMTEPASASNLVATTLTKGSGVMRMLAASSAPSTVNTLKASDLTLYLQLTDADGKVWTSDAIEMTEAEQMYKFMLDNADIDLSAVAKFEFVLKSTSGFGDVKPVVTLDADNLYMGNYGVALRFDQNPYVIIEGANQSIQVGTDGTITIKSNGAFEKFEGLMVDGVALVLGRDYTAYSGSTVVVLSADYVEDLATGNHVVTFLYEDGDVSTNLNVTPVSTTPPTEDPVTPPAEDPVVPPTEDPVVPPTEDPVVPPTDNNNNNNNNSSSNNNNSSQSSTSNSGQTGTITSANTGDSNNIAVGVVILVLGAAVCGFAFWTKTKKREQK